jgi:hypothetical protein
MYGHQASQDTQFEFLPGEKRECVADIRQKYQQLRSEMHSKSAGYLFEDDKLEQKRLNEAMRADLAGVLTPQEMQEFDLRMSDTAMQLRHNLWGFEPSEEEFRRLFASRQAFEEKYGPYGGTVDRTDPAARAEMDAARRAMEDEMKTALGSERFAEYQRAQDHQFQLLSRIADRFDSPAGAAARAYEMRKTVDDEVNRLRRNRELSDEQRREAMAAIRLETESSLQSVLGEAGYRNYRAWNRHWFDGLAK